MNELFSYIFKTECVKTTVRIVVAQVVTTRGGSIGLAGSKQVELRLANIG
jgi:hypothetical protein